LVTLCPGHSSVQLMENPFLKSAALRQKLNTGSLLLDFWGEENQVARGAF